MDRQEAVIEFLKALRIALNNASAYDKEHPYFFKTAEDFKEKIDWFFSFLNPIKIEFTPHSLYIDGKYWKKMQLYEELASIFHLRKIKTLKILRGFTIDELSNFLSAISLPVRESFRQGGVQNILSQKADPHFLVEGLDYSQLLKEQGEECKDIWVYLFKQSVHSGDAQKLNEFANDFAKIAEHFKAKDLLEDEELRHSLRGFLDYLKDKEKDKYHQCSKDLLKNILRDKGISQKDSLENIKEFLQDLAKEDYADVLLEQVLKGGGFGTLSFQIFSRLADESKHKEIAAALEEKIKNSRDLKIPANSINKIKELFSAPDLSFISIFYQNALQALLKDTSVPRYTDFDTGVKNYFYILLNLLSQESDKEKIGLLCGRFLKHLDIILQDEKKQYLWLLADVLSKKKKEAPLLTEEIGELDKRVCSLIEETVFNEDGLSGFEAAIDMVEKSALGFDFYRAKIFNERKLNPGIIRLFLKLFPQEVPLIYEELKKRHSDIDFLAEFIKCLERSNIASSRDMLKAIYGFSNNLLKLEVLKSMQSFAQVDEDFLFTVLETGEALVKKEALKTLRKEKALLKKALDKLLVVKSPFGRKNQLILENMSLVSDAGLAEAEEYLIQISLKPFFWNRNIRKKAKEALESIESI